MNILPILIAALNKEEAKNVKVYLNRTRAELDKKNELLFDLVRKNYPDNYDEEKLFKKLYPTNDNKLVFNRLKSRLLQDVSESLASFNFDTTDIHFIVNNYLLSKTFIDKNEFELAYYYIQRAQKKAEEIQHLELLELIYGEVIKLSQEIISIDPETYVQKRKDNRHKLTNLNEMDDVLAIIINKVRLRESSNSSSDKVYKQLEDVVVKFTSNKQFNNDTSFKIKIYQALSRILLNKKDYQALEDYLLKTYADFSSKKIFDKNTHATKIQLLIYICNTFFVNEKYKESLKYVDELKKALHEFDNLLYEKNVLYYYNVLNNNYTQIDTHKAIFYLNEAKENKLIYRHSYYMTFVYYNLTGCYYDLKDYKQAIKQLVKLYTHPSYHNVGDEMRLKINITELIIRVQQKETDFIFTKLKQLYKEFAVVLKQQHTDNELLKIIEQLAKLNFKTDAPLRADMKLLVKNYNTKDTAEVISYSLWLTENFLRAY